MYKTPEEMIEKIIEYLGQNYLCPTRKGMAEHLGFVNRQSLYDYLQRDKFKPVKDFLIKSIGYAEKPPNKKNKTGIKYINANQYHRDKYRKDPKYNLRIRIGVQMRMRLKNKPKGAFRHLPYTAETLKKHLERQFKPGMGWHNMDKWHIDHIVPVSAFNFKTVNDPEFRQCFALENLQPLWAVENMSKGGKVEETQLAIGI